MILEEIESPFNGKLTVMRDLAWGTYIQVNGLTQSGGIVKDVWKTSLKKVKGEKGNVRNCLVLGLGGGSVAQLISKYWMGVGITGVDIDPVIVGLGKKYLGLGRLNLKIVIEDASEFVDKEKGKYDLVCVDMYKGEEIPAEFNSTEFIEQVERLLDGGGITIFNRLYGPDDRLKSLQFGRKLEEVFGKVEYIYPQANVMFVCYNRG